MNIDRVLNRKNNSSDFQYTPDEFRKSQLSTVMALTLTLLLAACSESEKTSNSSSTENTSNSTDTETTAGSNDNSDSCETSNSDSSSGEDSSSSSNSSADTSENGECSTSEGETSETANDSDTGNSDDSDDSEGSQQNEPEQSGESNTQESKPEQSQTENSQTEDSKPNNGSGTCESSSSDSSSGQDSSSSSSSSASTSADGECQQALATNSVQPVSDTDKNRCEGEGIIWSTGDNAASEVCLVVADFKQPKFADNTSVRLNDSISIPGALTPEGCHTSQSIQGAIVIDYVSQGRSKLTGISQGLVTNSNGYIEHTVPMQGDFTYNNSHLSSTTTHDLLRGDWRSTEFPQIGSNYECVLASESLEIALSSRMNSLMLSIPSSEQGDSKLAESYHLTGFLIDENLRTIALNGKLIIASSTSARYHIDAEQFDRTYDLRIHSSFGNSVKFFEEGSSMPLLQGYYSKSGETIILRHRHIQTDTHSQISWIGNRDVE